MFRLLQSFPLRGLAHSLRVSAAKLPFRSDAATLVPDEVPMDTAAEPYPLEDAAALEARVLDILRVASKVPPGPHRRDALAEVSRLRRRAIELRRRTAADLRAQLAAARPGATASDPAE
jgi:hypothetical protein